NNSEDKTISVRVLFFGGAKDVTGASSIELSISSPATLREAKTLLIERFPRLNRFGRSLLFAVNQEYADPEKTIHSDDELAVFPPVSGGSNNVCDYRGPHDFFELTTVVIDVGAVARRVVLPECGATVTLDGYARKWTAGRETEYLVYE